MYHIISIYYHLYSSYRLQMHAKISFSVYEQTHLTEPTIPNKVNRMPHRKLIIDILYIQSILTNHCLWCPMQIISDLNNYTS